MIDPIAELLGNWSQGINVWSILLRICVSVFLGAIVGWERASKRHAAGLRTFILVSLASTVAMMLDIYLGSTFYLISGASVVATAIISENSTLFSSRNQIKGLTTSVGLWACGVIGLTIGAGLYTVTVAAFIAFISSLSLFPALESYLKDRSNHFEIHLELKNIKNLQDFVATIRELGMKIDDIEQNPAYVNSGLSVYSIAISVSSAELKKYKTHTEIIEALSTLEYVYHIEEM